MLLSLLLSSFAFAYEPTVICGANDPAGNVELDYKTTFRGGTIDNQLVIRNRNIINDFVSKGAILPGDLNEKGEYIVDGVGGPSSIQGPRGYREVTFVNDRLEIRLVTDRGLRLSPPLATFDFNGACMHMR